MPTLYAMGRMLVASCLLALASLAQASVIPSINGFEVSYAVNMAPGTSNGSDIMGTLLFEWDDSHFVVTEVGTLAGRGSSSFVHESSFVPQSALLIGYGRGVPGVGDERDHIYMFTSAAYAGIVGGLKWSEAFPGVTPDTRVRHDPMISLLAAGDIDAVSRFVQTEARAAAFDPAGSFVVLEWSTCPPGFQGLLPNCVPVGQGVPVPSTLLLIGVALAGATLRRRGSVVSA